MYTIHTLYIVIYIQVTESPTGYSGTPHSQNSKSNIRIDRWNEMQSLETDICMNGKSIHAKGGITSQ